MNIANDTIQHLELKRKAAIFLAQNGYIDIQYEYKLGQDKNGYAFRTDVSGIKGKKRVVVECGGTNTRKLSKLLPFVDGIYILPHGQAEPYKWEASMIVCSGCGNLKGMVGQGYERNPRSHKVN